MLIITNCLIGHVFLCVYVVVFVLRNYQTLIHSFCFQNINIISKNHAKSKDTLSIQFQSDSLVLVAQNSNL